ncbi:MAG: DUF3667 domain-containing protein [Prevotella sp.]|nr:DUF3667 domain-containing protein [Prevotella sp.]
MEQMREYYRRFRRWQQAAPHYENRHEDEAQHCHNCDATFSGNFCPVCGQRAGLGRVGWQSIKDNVALLWGMDSRSLGYTLLQLLGRPGYLVRDYISGRRQVSFPPVKMMVIVCLFVVIFETVFHLENDVVTIKLNVKEVNDVIAWINSQKSWATLLVQSLLILPTWLVFRFAPSYPRHTLPEGFFLQVFLSVQALLLSFFGYWSGTAELVLCEVYMYITYRQLFGYGWWSTLWRLVVVVLTQCAVMLVVITILIYFYGYERDERVDPDTIMAILFILTVTVVLTAVMLLITHVINRRSYRRAAGQEGSLRSTDDNPRAIKLA